MICKSLLFFSYLVKYHEILLHHIAFFTYDSYIVYRLFLYILLSHCIYYTSHVTETWILFESLCETCGQFIGLFPLRHVLFGSSSPYYCIICAISMCYICQLYNVCYLHISDILMFCILFAMSVMYIVWHNFLCISCQFLDVYEHDTWSCKSCSLILISFIMYWHSYAYFNFAWELLSVLYTFTYHIL